MMTFKKIIIRNGLFSISHTEKKVLAYTYVILSLQIMFNYKTQCVIFYVFVNFLVNF